MTGDNNQSIEVTGGPVPFKLRGREPFLWLLIVGLLAGVAYLTVFSLGQWGTPIDLGKTMKDMQESHTAIVEAQNEGTYVLSVCLNANRKKECEQLNLQMPDSLRKKQRRE